MKSECLRPVTEEEQRCYREEGIVLLKGLFDPDWVAHLIPLVEEVMAEPGPLHMELEKKEEEKGRFFFDTFLWPRRDGFREFVEGSPAAAIVARVMGAGKVNIFFDQLLVKEPGTSEPIGNSIKADLGAGNAGEVGGKISRAVVAIHA